MLYDENNEIAAQYLKQVIPKLVELNLPTNPTNYAVWYEYTAGRNSQLNSEIDILVANTTLISKEIATDLYSRHIRTEDAVKTAKANEELKKSFFELISSIHGLSEDNQDFIGLLSDQANTITPDMDIDTFQSEIKRTLDASAKIQSSNSEYQQKFMSKAKELEKLKSDFERVKQEANTDALTQLSNRKAFNEALQNSMLQAYQEKTPLSLALIDIDHFKQFNDTHGHLTGDQVLRFVGQLITQNIKGKDFAARFGGEEFVIILPHTSLKGAYINSDNIRTFIAKNKIVNKTTKQSIGSIHISAGVTEYIPGETPDDFLHRADIALYESKENGRNQVTAHPPLA